MNRNFFSLLISGLVLIGLTGCAHYRARPLKTIKSHLPTEQPYIAFNYKLFSKQDCQKQSHSGTVFSSSRTDKEN